MSEQTSEYCADCGWRTESHGHWRECTRPKEEVEEHNRAVAIEKERDALLLQIDEIHRVNALCGEILKKEIDGLKKDKAEVTKEWNDALRLYSELQARYDKYAQHERDCAVIDDPQENACTCGFIETVMQPKPKRCDSYWDGNQCEGSMDHEGKHCWMGWSWVVSPPPLETTPEIKRKDEGPVCTMCGWNNDANHGGGSRKMYTMGTVTKCGECLPTSR